MPPHPLISLLAAVAENGVIGRENALAWRLPDDLKRFKAITLGKPVLMGRRTFESIGKALPGRTNLVLSRSPRWSAPGALVVHDFAQAIACSGSAEELVVIGGAQIYHLALPHASRIYLTRVHASVSGDTHLPELDPAVWREVSREDHAADDRHPYAFSFCVLERVNPL